MLFAKRWREFSPATRPVNDTPDPAGQHIPLASPQCRSVKENVCGYCGERACPALGCEAAPIQQNVVYLIRLSAWLWGCCAAQRRTSLLATA